MGKKKGSKRPKNSDRIPLETAVTSDSDGDGGLDGQGAMDDMEMEEQMETELLRQKLRKSKRKEKFQQENTVLDISDSESR